MKLLLDQNLSFRLLDSLRDAFPGSTQVSLVGLQEASDREIWDFAREQGFVIVTKDADFHELCLLLGPPPKVVWLKIGNASTRAVRDKLLAKAGDISAALARDDVYFVEVY